MRGHIHIAQLRAPARRYQRGLTLIELMVSITITLIVVAALIALFLNVSNAQREMAKVNQQVESGRVSMFVLEKELQHAGFWENYVPQFDDLTLTTKPANVPTGTPPDPCLPYTPANWTSAYMRSLLDIPLQAYDAIPASCTLLTNAVANSDVLVVRHADTCLTDTPNCDKSVPAGNLYFQSSLCGTSQKPSDFVLSTTGFGMLARDCVTPSPLRKFISDIYYVRDYADTVGDRIPTLVRSRFDLTLGGQQEPVPLIEGIERIRVELGLDTTSSTGEAVDYTKTVNWEDPNNRTKPTNRGDGSPDGAFVHCSKASPCTADQLINVVAVKVYVLARSTTATASYTDSRTYKLGSETSLPSYNDHYKRHVFATSVRLNNVAGRRDTP